MRLWFVLGIVLLGVSSHATAFLGGDANSVSQDGRATSASASVLASLTGPNAATGVRLQPVLTAEGVSVNEYLFQNQVFAISWGGQVMPDLSQLLGSHFAGFQQAAQNRPRAGRNAPLVVATPDVVVHAYGHMRAFKGVAYLPGAIPSGFDITKIEP